MTLKERVLKTYTFQLTDRIPLDFCADERVYDALIQNVSVKDGLELMEYFHIDFRWARPRWIGPELVDEQGRKTDYFGIPREGEAFGYSGAHPLCYVRTKTDVDSYPWPKAEYWDYDIFSQECERFEEYAVYGGAWGMNFENLSRKFKGKLVLQGSIDTQRTLPFGTVNDVKEEVRSRIALYKEQGGFVLGPSQHLLSHLPLENIIAMYETAWDEGWIKKK